MQPGEQFLLGADLVKDLACLVPPTTTPRASPPRSTATSSTASTVSWAPTSSRTVLEHIALWGRGAQLGSRCACEPVVRRRCTSTPLDLAADFSPTAKATWPTEISTKFTLDGIGMAFAAASLILESHRTIGPTLRHPRPTPHPDFVRNRRGLCTIYAHNPHQFGGARSKGYS